MNDKNLSFEFDNSLLLLIIRNVKFSFSIIWNRSNFHSEEPFRVLSYSLSYIMDTCCCSLREKQFIFI